MKKTPHLPEIVFSSSNPAESKRISRHVKAGRLENALNTLRDDARLVFRRLGMTIPRSS